MNRRTTLKTLAAVGAVAALAACEPMAASKDIVDIAASNDDFSTLVAAVGAAGLVDTLKGDGPFTVFAPTNEAFAALPAGTVENLLKPENKDQLTQILTYHVVPGSYPAGSILGKRGSLTTAQGSSVTVDGRGDGVTVDGANVISADIAASNGVIHVIDSVILP